MARDRAYWVYANEDSVLTIPGAKSTSDLVKMALQKKLRVVSVLRTDGCAEMCVIDEAFFVLRTNSTSNLIGDICVKHSACVVRKNRVLFLTII